MYDDNDNEAIFETIVNKRCCCFLAVHEKKLLPLVWLNGMKIFLVGILPLN
jgi:hypothetical protein